MTGIQHSDLSRWLTTVTRGLPVTMASDIQKEITAHYEDAMSHYLSTGLEAPEAHQCVMKDLGATQAPSQQFRDMYYGKHYFLAAIASILIVFIPFILQALLTRWGISGNSEAGKLSACFYDVSVAGLTVYVLFTLRRLLNWRFDLTYLNTAFTAVMVSLSLQIVCDISSRFLFGYSLNISPISTRSFLAIQNPPEFLLALLSQLCFLTLGAGLVWISVGLIRFKPKLYGLNKALTILLTLLGLGLGSGSLLSNLQFGILAEIVGLLVTTTHMLIWPMMLLLFFRVTYHNPAHPTRFA